MDPNNQVVAHWLNSGGIRLADEVESLEVIPRHHEPVTDAHKKILNRPGLPVRQDNAWVMSNDGHGVKVKNEERVIRCKCGLIDPTREHLAWYCAELSLPVLDVDRSTVWLDCVWDMCPGRLLAKKEGMCETKG